jgi:hypothetical protein
MLTIDLTGAPPTPEQLATERKALVRSARRCRLLLALTFAVLMWAVWATRNSFTSAVLAGMSLSFVFGLLLLYLLRFAFLLDFLRPASPAECLLTLPALSNEMATRYLAGVKCQGRLLTALEARAIQSHGAQALEHFEKARADEKQRQANDAWQFVNGRPYEPAQTEST